MLSSLPSLNDSESNNIVKNFDKDCDVNFPLFLKPLLTRRASTLGGQFRRGHKLSP
jgi:hypothetical protein